MVITSKAASHRLLGVQYLRALAALMVAYYHLLQQSDAYLQAPSAHRWLTTDRLYNGVSIFFVISGFIMYVTGAESRPLEFAQRRLVRILPLYWLLTLTLFACALLAPHLFRTIAASPEYLVKSLLFIPYPNPTADGRLFPLLAPGWTLNCEMFFYAIFMFALFAPLRWRAALIIAALGLLVALGLASPHSKLHSYYGFYTNVMMSQFLLGIVIGLFYRAKRLSIPAPLSVLLMLSGLILLFCPLGDFLNGDAADTLGATLLVLGTVALDKAWPFWRIPALLGDSSYSIYLTHLFTLGALRLIWVHAPHLRHLQSASAIFYAVVSMACICVVSVAVYRAVEQPILRASHRQRPAPQSVRTAVARP